MLKQHLMDDPTTLDNLGTEAATCHNFPASFVNFSQCLHLKPLLQNLHAYPFCETTPGTTTPGTTTPGTYLDVAIAKSVKLAGKL